MSKTKSETEESMALTVAEFLHSAKGEPSKKPKLDPRMEKPSFARPIISYEGPPPYRDLSRYPADPRQGRPGPLLEPSSDGIKQTSYYAPDQYVPSSQQPFGALIITRPNFFKHDIDTFHVCAANPAIVKKWLGSSPDPVKLLMSSLAPKNYRMPKSSINKTIQDVHELTIRSTPARMATEKDGKGFATLCWNETNSGNEFIIQTSVWT